MRLQTDSTIIRWKLHLNAAPEAVYEMLSTDDGRASFWAESAREQDGSIQFVFPNQAKWAGRILEAEPHRIFKVEYYGGSITTFELESDGAAGTDLTLTDHGVPEEDQNEVLAGWVSVLLALKASVDFGVDLRSHDPQRTWDHQYVDN